MAGIEIELTECEVHIAAAVARWRVGRAISGKFKDGHGEAGLDRKRDCFEDRDLPGAKGELAWAKWRGIYWGGDQNDFGKWGDGSGVEVRATRHANGCLIVFPNDPAERRCVLVVVNGNQCRIVGWVRAGWAKCSDFLKTEWHEGLRPGSKPQYWVPQSRLSSLSEIPR